MRTLKNNADLFFRMGTLFLREEKFASAAKAYQKVISIDSKNSTAQFRLGLAYYHLKEFTLAKKQFETVLSLDHHFENVNQCLSNCLLELRDHETALYYYFRQLEQDPWFETYYNIAVLLMMKDRFKEALVYFEQALQKNPEDVATHLNCGSIYLKRNELDKAILSYQQANKIKPHDPEILHILSAIEQKQTPQAAPTEFITHLFDQYAPYYDFHLTDRLKYSVPQKILDVFLLESALISDQAHLKIVDLGCGTGLCGVLFKSHASKLIGVDLSENMLSVAREKNTYDELICDDVTHALNSFFEIDLILAADVFTYLGDLNAIFDAAEKALSKNGLFIFTVEKTTEPNFILQPTVRYAHNKAYLESLMTANHFMALRIDNVILRMQKNVPVEGYLVVMKKVDMALASSS